jgi:2-methylcitrate dehydratase PrpD
MAHAVEPTAGQTTDFAQVFAAFSAGFEVSRHPSRLVDAARLNVLDTLACSMAGFRAPGAPEVLELVRDWGGKPEAQVLWSDLRVPAPQAAWINGIMAHACDYDDTHDKAILHGGISVVPAALAAVDVAGRPVSGKDFYAGVIVGLELICRIGIATRIGLIKAGFIYSSLFSYFAAAAAAARVLRLTPEQTVNAIGIAFTQAAGTHQVTRDGALTKRMQPGFGARAGLTAVAMALKGIRGAQRTFEGEDGLGRIYLQNELDSAKLRAGLGETFHFEDLAYKPYPCCRMNHCAIDAALQLRARPGFDWKQVSAINVRMNGQGHSAVAVPLDVRRAPRTVVQAQFSVCYTVACALVQGRVGLSDFTDEAFKRRDIMDLAARVTPTVDPEFERICGRHVSPARIEVVVGGWSHAAEVIVAKGGLDAPMSNTEMMLKIEDCLSFGGFDPTRAGLYAHAIAGLERSTDVALDMKQLIGSITAT